MSQTEKSSPPLLAFVGGSMSFPGLQGDVYTVAPDGTGLRRVTHLRAQLKDVEWSPDGSRIAFIHGTGEFPPSWVEVVNPDGTGERKITQGQVMDQSLSWSPEGSRIAFDRLTGGEMGSGSPDIYVQGIDRKGLQDLTQGGGSQSGPDWSPDGRHIAFVSTVRGALRLFVMDTDGRGAHTLKSAPPWVFSPSWSPDGGSIAFVVDHLDAGVVGGGRFGRLSGIGEVDAEGSNYRTVYTCDRPACSGVGLGEPNWSPDGSLIAFTMFRKQHVHVMVMNSDGTHVHEVPTPFADACCASWRPAPH